MLEKKTIKLSWDGSKVDEKTTLVASREKEKEIFKIIKGVILYGKKTR